MQLHFGAAIILACRSLPMKRDGHFKKVPDSLMGFAKRKPGELDAPMMGFALHLISFASIYRHSTADRQHNRMYILFYFILLLIFLYGVLINYYERAFGKIPVFSCDGDSLREPVRLSVIIPARNEEKNILRCLQSINNQTYPSSSFEVIVVNDHSTDDTTAIV